MAQALSFLDMLDLGGRHTIASEHPIGGRGGCPKWEAGATYEARERKLLIADIEERQARRSNVYYQVNRPCSAADRQGLAGKNKSDDIIGIRALAFDIDHFKNFDRIVDALPEALWPSLIIDTGGGLHLLYLLNEVLNVNLCRPTANDEQRRFNDRLGKIRALVVQLAHNFETMLRAKFPDLKIDNMSNVDRVMRLPGTMNYPKAEKIARGQVPALI
jgi:hypothetical protein